MKRVINTFLHQLKAAFFTTSIILLPGLLSAQVTLHTESFETDGEGSRYTSNTYVDCLTQQDFFFRTNTNPVTPSGCAAMFGSTLTGLQGSYYWASEDIRASTPTPNSRPPGNITTQNINISSYNNLTVSLYIACSSNNGARWESSDSINIKASFDGGAFILVGRFMGGGTDIVGANLRLDSNLDGQITGADPVTTYDDVDFTQVIFSIPGTGSNLRIQLDYDQLGGTEELAIDLIEVKGFFFLPIELTSFTAQMQEKEVLLNWQTASERDNAGFELERSEDTREWIKLGFVEGQGNSTTTHAYSFTDNSPLPGVGYYRLKQMDTNGEVYYSSINTVYYNSDLTIGVTPNPVFGEAFSFRIPETWGESVTVMLYSPVGQCLQQTTFSPGIQTMDISGLPAGCYTLCLWNGSEWTTEKVMIWR